MAKIKGPFRKYIFSILRKDREVNLKYLFDLAKN